MLHQTGVGILGPVFRAFDVREDRLVAIKAFHLDLLPEHVVRVADRLRRLAAAAAPHPALVPLFDAGLEGTTPFLVTAHLSGETLDVWIRQRAPMPLDHALRIVSALAETIDSAAAFGLKHGALHPRDIFVENGQDLVGVTGFGVIDALAEVGVEGAAQRRPYAAPERWIDRWGTLADVYSLGVLAHEIFTGRRPAGAGEQDGAFATELSAEQRVQLRRVIGTALNEAPERRFPTATAFAQALADAGGRAAAWAPRPTAVPLAVPPHESIAHDPPQGEPGPDNAGATPVDPVPQMAADPGAYDVVAPVEHPPAAGHDIDPVMAAGPSDEPAPATPELEAPARPLPPAPFAYGTAARSRRGTRWGLTGLVAAAGLALGVVSGAGIARLWTGGADAETGDAAAGAPAAGRGDVSLARESSDRESDRPDAEPRAALDARRALAPAGRLVVRSQPSGALVTVDGRLLGETPMARDLPLGTHAVRVAHPGHVPRTERVTLAAATPMRTLSVTLQPGLAPVAATRGAIDVDSRPRGARVSVDGRFIGLAPLRVADLAAGEHQVALDLGGYEPATSRVQVEPGRAASVRLTLRATH